MLQSKFFKLKFKLLIVTSLVGFCSFSQEKLSLLFVGDVMQHGGQIAAAFNKNNNSYDYKDCFKFVKPIISGADISIANLEVTHAGKPYKGYPQFSAPPQLSEAVVDAGFNVIITANNHACDGGKKGILGTLDVLDKLGVKHTGTFRSQAERDKNYPLLVEKNGFRVAILNYTYSTNGLSVKKPLLVNYIDSATMLKDFAKARKMGFDYIICTMHWGDEYKDIPGDYQKKWEKFCYDQGADMVIGSHPHVLQPVEQKVLKGEEKLTAWSLGNFISNQRDRYKNGGMILRSFLEKDSTKVKIVGTDYIFTYVHTKQEGITKPYYLLPDFPYSTYNPSFLDSKSQAEMNLFFADSRELYTIYSKKVKEYKVSENLEISNLYQKFMKGYFTLILEESSYLPFQSQIHPLLQSEIKQITLNDGRFAKIFGMYESKEELLGNARYLKDLGVSISKIGFFNTTSLQLEEIKQVQE
jgi:poly-gamma-glutamate synthesis protein (capsule biosynthesis protein)